MDPSDKIFWDLFIWPVGTYLASPLTSGTFKGLATVNFFVPSSKKTPDYLPASAQAIYSYVKESFRDPYWHSFFLKDIFGNLHPLAVTATLVSPPIAECKVKPILDGIFKIGTFNGKLIYFQFIKSQ